MNSTAVPLSPVRVARWSRIVRCTVTSSAEVGSSAMSSFGWDDRPMPMSTRCFIPPENWCGNWRSLDSASASPACLSTVIALALASLPRLALPLATRVSSTWKPMFHTGFRFDIGSCGTNPIRLPRMSSKALPRSFARSRPSNMMDPPVISPLPGSRSMIAWAVVDLPEPDSPTIATVSPGMIVKSTPLTAGTMPLWVLKPTLRPRISSSGVTPPGVVSIGSLIDGPSPSGRARHG